MDISPVTNKTLGIIHNYESEKFRDVRKCANMEYKIRKTRRNRKEKFPKFKVDDEFVAAKGGCGSKKHYHLVKVIDFEESSIGVFNYYCILLKTTDHKMLERIRRFVNVYESGWSWHMIYAKISPKGIIWTH